jgi:hypothetical protein
MKISLFDNNIPDYSAAAIKAFDGIRFNQWQLLNGFTYERDTLPSDENSIMLVTDESLFNLNFERVNCKNKFGLLLEPKSIKPHVYETLKVNANQLRFYKKIFTHSQELLDTSDLFELMPFLAGSWILKDDISIYKKTKNISLVANNRHIGLGHHLRHQIAAKYKHKIDTYGPAYTDLLKDYANTTPTNLRQMYNLHTGNLFRAFKEYRYNFAIHSIKYKNYFDEKLLNCFFTGTVPILYGASNVGDFFDKRGIIEFDNIDDVDDIIKNCSEADYTNRLPYIKNNYNKAFEYISFDNYVFNLIKKYEI